MGRLRFSRGLTLELDDRALAHVYAAIQIKMNRRESFHFTWKDDAALGGGRTMVWIHSETSVACTLNGVVGGLDRRWIESLTATANSFGGMHIVDPPAADGPAGTERPHG